MPAANRPEPSSRALNCPRCEVPLAPRVVTTLAEGWEVEVDCCLHSCGGVWIEKEDFQVDPKANLLMNQALQPYNMPAIKGLEPEAQAVCPECAIPMEPYRWKHTDVALDRCPQCRGLWFDGNEITAIQRQLREKQAAAPPLPAQAPAAKRNPMPLVVGILVVALVLGVVAARTIHKGKKPTGPAHPAAHGKR